MGAYLTRSKLEEALINIHVIHPRKEIQGQAVNGSCVKIPKQLILLISSCDF